MTAIATALPSAESAAQTRDRIPWLPFVPLLAIPVVGTSPEGLDLVVLLIGGTFLLMSIRDPIWAVAAILLSELTIRNFYLEFGGLQVSTRLLLALAIPIVLLPHLTAGDRRAGPRARRLFSIGLAFFAVTVIANLLFTDIGFTLKFGRYLLTGLMALFIVPLAIQSRRDLVQVARVGLCIAIISAIVAILQHYSDRGAPLIQLVPNSVTLEGFEGWRGRSLGLAENPVYLSNDLMAFFFAPLAFLFLLPAPRARRFLLVVAILGLALYFSGTRSWILGAAPAVAVMAFFLDSQSRPILIALLVAGALAFWLWTGYSGNRYTQGVSDDDSAATRPVLWSASAQIAMDNPVLGVGHDKFLELSPEYADSIDREFAETHDAVEALGTTQPHNDFLNVWLSFGTIAFALFLAFLFVTGRNFILAAKVSADPLLKGIALGGLGALVAFGVNSAFHNFFDSTLTMWLMGGFSLVLIRLAESPREGEPRYE